MNAYRYELIGTRVAITHAINASLAGITGTIIDETKHTLVIKTPKGVKRVVKNGITICVDRNGEQHTVNGKSINMSPEERVRIK